MTYAVLGHIAFGADKEVSLFCEVLQKHASGLIHFRVINGAWDGTYDPWKGTLFPHRYPEYVRPAKVLWRGEYKRDWDSPDDGRYYHDYDRAMAWIQERVSHPWLMRWRMIVDVFQNLKNYRLVVRVEKKPEPKQKHFNGYENDLDDEIPF